LPLTPKVPPEHVDGRTGVLVSLALPVNPNPATFLDDNGLRHIIDPLLQAAHNMFVSEAVMKMTGTLSGPLALETPAGFKAICGMTGRAERCPVYLVDDRIAGRHPCDHTVFRAIKASVSGAAFRNRRR